MKVIFISFLVVAFALVLASTFFAVQEVEVEFVATYEDQTTLDRDQIGRTADVIGKNIFTVSENGLISLVHGAIPRAKVVAVERIFPTTVKLYVTERVPVFAVANGETYALIDREGVVLECVSTSGDVPTVTGVAVTSAVPGKVLVSNGGATDKLIEIISAFEGMSYVGNNFRTTVQSLDVAVPESCVLQMRAGVKFEFNNTTNVYYQAISFANWFSVNPDYRDGGTARISNSGFNTEVQRFDIIYSPTE